MKFLGSKNIMLRRIKGPGDIKKRVSDPRVHELAESIMELGGTIAPIVVRKFDTKLIAGRDRYAAHLINAQLHPKRDEDGKLIEPVVSVMYVEATDQEAKKLERHENIFRRHDPSERQRLLAEMSNEVTEEILQAEPELRPDGPGPTKSARGKARQIVADKMGTTPETVRQAEHKANNKAKPPPGVKPVNVFGMVVDPELLDSIEDIRKVVDDSAALVSRALAAMTRLGTSRPFPAAQLQSIQQALRDVGHSIRRMSPEAICPHCKCIPQLQMTCVGCAGVGWVSAPMLVGVPKNLLNDLFPMVRFQDDVVSAQDFFPKHVDTDEYETPEPEAPAEDEPEVDPFA